MTTTEASNTRSVEYFTDLIRRHAHLWTDQRLQALEYIRVFARGEYPGTEVEDMAAIRNVLTAADIVAAELAAGS